MTQFAFQRVVDLFIASFFFNRSLLFSSGAGLLGLVRVGERLCRGCRSATGFREDEVEMAAVLRGIFLEKHNLLNIAQAYVLLLVYQHVHRWLFSFLTHIHKVVYSPFI